MTIAVSHDRNYWKIEAKPSGVFRILCLGDSLTYGAGVQPDETLPEQLEEFLNRAVWNKQVEVINQGVSGYALYDDWHRFIHRGYRFQPDLVIIIICDNDIELFSVNAHNQQGRKITYEDHVENCWRQNSPHYQNFREALKSIGIQMQAHNIPVILAYYDIWSQPIRMRIVSDLAGFCNENEVGFVDLSEDYLDERSARTKTDLRVSEADGHPSAEAHRQSARKLARYIVKYDYLGVSETDSFTESALIETIFKNGRDMKQLGYRPEFVYHNVRNLLNLKRSSKSRLRLDEDRLLPERSYKDILSDLEKLSAFQRQQMFWEAYARWLDLHRQQLFYLNQHAEEVTNRISKGLFVLGNRLARKSDTVLNYFNVQNIQFNDEYFNRIPTLIQQWSELLTVLQSEIQPINPQETSEDKINNARINLIAPISKEETYLKINDRFKELEINLQSLYALYKSYVDLFQQAQPLSDKQIMNAFLGLAQAINGLSEQIQTVNSLMQLDRLVNLKTGGHEKPLTTCRIRMTSASETPLSLWLQLRSIYPERKPISEMRWIIRDGRPHLYRFDLPLSYVAEASFAVYPENKTDTAFIEFFNNPERRLRLEIPAEKAGINGRHNISPFLLLPQAHSLLDIVRLYPYYTQNK